MGLFKKYVTCIIAFFIPFHSTFVTFVTLCQFYSVVSLSYSQGIERYIWFLQGNKISKEVVNTRLNKIAFLDTYVCINNPYWQSSGIIIFSFFVAFSAVLSFPISRRKTFLAPENGGVGRLAFPCTPSVYNPKRNSCLHHFIGIFHKRQSLICFCLLLLNF